MLTCANRLRTVIDVHCGELQRIGVPLLGNDVAVWKDSPDPQVASRLRFAGHVIANDGHVLELADHGDGPEEIPISTAFLEPTLANFNTVVQILTQDQSERTLRIIREEGGLRAGGASFKSIQLVLSYLGRAGLQIAHNIPLRIGHLVDQTGGMAFPPVEVFEKPTSRSIQVRSRDGTWTQGQLDRVGPYDRATLSGRGRVSWSSAKRADAVTWPKRWRISSKVSPTSNLQRASSLMGRSCRPLQITKAGSRIFRRQRRLRLRICRSGTERAFCSRLPRPALGPRFGTSAKIMERTASGQQSILVG